MQLDNCGQIYGRKVHEFTDTMYVLPLRTPPLTFHAQSRPLESRADDDPG